MKATAHLMQTEDNEVNYPGYAPAVVELTNGENAEPVEFGVCVPLRAIVTSVLIVCEDGSTYEMKLDIPISVVPGIQPQFRATDLKIRSGK